MRILAALQLAPTISLVVENLHTGIALPDIDGTVAFMRMGLPVDQLEALGWLRGVRRHLYWGDLDAHGFAILARAGRRFPSTVSVLMDEDMSLAHRKLWVREPTPCRAASPEGLTVAELAVYEGLRANRWGERVRLEQERIAGRRRWRPSPTHVEFTYKFNNTRISEKQIYAAIPLRARPGETSKSAEM